MCLGALSSFRHSLVASNQILCLLTKLPVLATSVFVETMLFSLLSEKVLFPINLIPLIFVLSPSFILIVMLNLAYGIY